MHYRFAEFILDTAAERVTGPDGPVALRRRTFLLLQSLVEHAPAVVGRDQILDEVWGHDALSATVLPQAIGEIRQALADSAQAPRLIETRHRRGYRLMVPVERVESPETSIPASGGSSAVVEPASAIHSPAAGPAPRRHAWQLPLVLMAVAMVGAIGWLLLRSASPSDPATPRPALALSLTSAGSAPGWLADAGAELLAVALAADDRMQLLRGDGRLGQPSGNDTRWQVWMREGLGADYALTGAWQADGAQAALSYSLLRLEDGRIIHSAIARDDDLAALSRQVASDLRRHLKLMDPDAAWLTQLPRDKDARAAYYTGLAALTEGRSADAVAALERASAAGAADTRVGLALARAYRAAGRYRQARQQFQVIRAKEGALSVGERLRFEAEAALLDYRHADAAASLAALHRLLPEDREVGLSLVDAQLRARQGEAAAMTLVQLAGTAERPNDDPRFHLAQAQLAQWRQDLPARRTAAEQALAQAQRFGRETLIGEARRELAQIRRSEGDLAGARQELEALAGDAGAPAEVHVQLGSLMRDLGDFAAADRHLHQAATAFAASGDRAGELRATVERYTVQSERGHSESAHAELLALEPAVLELDDAPLLARYFNTLGVQATRNSQTDAATSHLQRAASEARRAQLPAQEAGAYNNLGQALARSRRHADAAAMWERALAIFRDSGDRMGEAITLSNLAAIASTTGNLARSRDLNAQAVRLFRDLKAKQHLARTAFNLGLAVERNGELLQAADLYHEALDIYRQGSAGDPVLSVATALSRVYLAQASLERARQLLQSIEAQFAATSNPLARSHVLSARGAMEALAGNADAGRRLFEQALALRSQDEKTGWATWSELDLLALQLDQGDVSEWMRASAERIGKRMQTGADGRGQARALLLEATALIRLKRPAEAARVLEQVPPVLAIEPDSALDRERERLQLLASADSAASRRARLLSLGADAEHAGFRTFALRCRLDAEPDSRDVRSQIATLGLTGLLPER